MTDLGPDDSTSATSATAAFTWSSSGTYKVCYKLAGGSYAQVGTSTVTVTGTSNCTWSSPQIGQRCYVGEYNGVSNTAADFGLHSCKTACEGISGCLGFFVSPPTGVPTGCWTCTTTNYVSETYYSEQNLYTLYTLSCAGTSPSVWWAAANAFAPSSELATPTNPSQAGYWDQRNNDWSGDWSPSLKSRLSAMYNSARPNDALRERLNELCLVTCLAESACAYYAVSSDSHWNHPGFVCAIVGQGTQMQQDSLNNPNYVYFERVSAAATPNITTGTSMTIAFSGGSALDLASGQDAAKVVLSSGDCSSGAAGGGTSEVTDLGPDDSTSATSATAAFTWTSAGTYKVCYKVDGGSYAQVGTSTVTVSGTTTPTGSPTGSFTITPSTPPTTAATAPSSESPTGVPTAAPSIGATATPAPVITQTVAFTNIQPADWQGDVKVLLSTSTASP